MQQARTFILSSEPIIKYYRNGTELRVSSCYDYQFQGEIKLNRQVYARRSGRDRFEIITKNRTYYLREMQAGDADQWIQAINDAINDYCEE